MYQRVMAFDFDGTLAENDRVPPVLVKALEQLHLAGYALFLATGRLHAVAPLGSLGDLFTGIVWENGAVLSLRDVKEPYLPFGQLDPGLVEALGAAGVPLDCGLAIGATWASHEDIVWRIVGESGSDAVVSHNKGAVMIAPPGTSKGAGLERLLALSGFSPRNLVGFGDGENDHSLLQVADTAIAVADAVPSLKMDADLVTSRPGPAGVLEALEAHWLDGREPTIHPRHKRPIPLGSDTTGSEVSLAGASLISQNLGIFGDSGTGKSWVAGLLVEGMHAAGYQVLLIDPEGDHRGLRSLPRMIALAGDEAVLPAPALVSMLLEEVSISVVLDLCAYPVTQRGAYIADLLHALRPLRGNKYRPHWIVMEEAQQFLPLSSTTALTTLQPMLAGGGWAFVTYRPDRMADPVREALDCCLITRLSQQEAIQSLEPIGHLPSPMALATTPQASVWLCGQRLVQLRAANRRIPHIRHLYKYLDTPLPKYKRFHFRHESDYLELEAASLFEFKELIPSLPIESLTYHQARGDFARWTRSTLGDGVLAAHLDKLAHRKQLTGDALRQALQQRVADRYIEIHTQARQDT